MKKSFSPLFFAVWIAFALGCAVVAKASQPAQGSSSACAVACEKSPRLTLTVDTPWVVSPDEPEAMQRALEDVKTDWYKVMGRLPVVLPKPPPATYKGPVIYLGRAGPWWKTLNAQSKMSSATESFSLIIRTDAEGRPALACTGADMRGAIFAAYALSEEILGVDPWYFWTDNEPAYRGTIDIAKNFSREFPAPTFRYRGFFINDEDLLNIFAADPLRENVFSTVMQDRICETVLRLRGNMIVPGTFNFPDEKCHELAARRGLIINMHHILVVGLNTFRWPENQPFSYSKHPEMMEKLWQACIDEFKDKEVVWTLGYRGKHDRPFWADEPEITTPEARGAIITKAIAKQAEMINKAQPGAPMIANLWIEGADLYQAGHLKLPPGVIAVWPDNGAGKIRDDGRVRAGQGIYYHTAMMNGRCNQLGEMTGPAIISSELRRFVNAGATEFFLVNTSDVRPVPLSTGFSMAMAWDAAPWMARDDAQNQKTYLLDWSRRQFGDAAAPRVAEIYTEYFDLPYHRQDTERASDNVFHRMIYRIEAKARPLIAAGKPLTPELLQYVRECAALAAQNHDAVALLSEKAEVFAPQIPEARRAFYTAHILTPLQIHLQSIRIFKGYSGALEAYAAGDKAKAAACAGAGLRASDVLATALRRAEYGKWAAWYRGEKLVGLNESYESLRQLRAAMLGEPRPPIRVRERWPEIYKYQERFSENFPLMYPAKTK